MKKAWVIVRTAAETSGPHVPPSTWLGALVRCGCGHGIGAHSAWGCDGDFRGRCSCMIGASGVLGSAVDAAREDFIAEGLFEGN